MQMGAKRTRSKSLQRLPDELVEKIIAMMPFPAVFKARALSKTWLARFSPIEPLDDGKELERRATRADAKKSVVSALQKEVGAAAFQEEVSANWPIFSPCRFSRSDSCGYELTSHTWRSLPSLSFLPESIWEDCRVITTAGALLFLGSNLSSKLRKLYVVNIFTRSWKVLPPCPHPKVRASHLLHRPVFTNSIMQNYKVIMLFEECLDRGISGEYYIKTYDSKANAWSSKRLGRIPPLYCGWCMVHLNGVLYWMEGQSRLYAIDCEEAILTEYLLSEQLDGISFSSRELVVCNSSLVIVLTVIIDSAVTHKLMKIDIETGRLWPIGVGCPHLEGKMYRCSQTPFGHGDCIYISFLESRRGGLTYNLPKDKWSCWDVSPNRSFFNSFWDNYWIRKPCVVEPGLNLFMPV